MPSKNPNPPNQALVQQQHATTAPIYNQWLTTKEAAAYANTAISTFRTWDLTNYRPNKNNLYRKADIDAYIKQFAYRSNAELSTTLEPKRQALSTTLEGKR